MKNYEMYQRLAIEAYKFEIEKASIPNISSIERRMELLFEIKAYDMIYHIKKIEIDQDDIHNILISFKAAHSYEGIKYCNAQLRLFSIWTVSDKLLLDDVKI